MDTKRIGETEIINLIKKVYKNKKTIELHPPYVGKNEITEIVKTINKKSISTYGKATTFFENKISKLTKSKYVIALNSGTSALQLSILASGVRHNEEVLVPSLNFIASVNAIIYNNAIPHFIESDINLGIDTVKLDKYLSSIAILKDQKCYNKFTKRFIRAIVPTHVLGHVSNMTDLVKICKKYKLILIEDASEALGSFYKKKHAGSFGVAGVLSFNGNKIITTGAGGAVITNSKKIADKVRFLSTTAKSFINNNQVHNEVGYNFKMPSLNAAVGIAQLNKFKNIEKKEIINKKYEEVFNSFKNVEIIKSPKNCKSNYWLNALWVKDLDINKLLLISKKKMCKFEKFGHQ